MRFRVRTNRSGTLSPRETSSKGPIFQGTEHQRLFVWGHFGRGHFIMSLRVEARLKRFVYTDTREQRTIFLSKERYAVKRMEIFSAVIKLYQFYWTWQNYGVFADFAQFSCNCAHAKFNRTGSQQYCSLTLSCCV
jgi:hypothetical protein